MEARAGQEAIGELDYTCYHVEMQQALNIAPAGVADSARFLYSYSGWVWWDVAGTISLPRKLQEL